MKIYNAREQASGLECRREPGDDGFEDLAVCEAGIVEICVVEAWCIDEDVVGIFVGELVGCDL
jgi:hypothetical protein